MNTSKAGKFYEMAVCEYLTSNGVKIIKQNFSCKMGEIDIIGIQEEVLIFFEVKYRKSDFYGNALEAVNVQKQKRIINSANFFLLNYKWDGFIRFDVIGITGDNLNWIKNAFC